MLKLIIFGIIGYVVYRIYKRYFSSGYEACYKVHEEENIAVLGMCGGRVLSNPKREICLNCPYFVGDKEKEKTND